MTYIQNIFSETTGLSKFPSTNLKKNLLSKYPNVASDSKIQGGRPTIKGTRVIASDIFRAIIKGYSPQVIIMQFKEMDVHLNLEQLNQAFSFTLEWLYSLHAQKKT